MSTHPYSFPRGQRAIYVHSTIHIPLPRELWRLCDGCVCEYCSADGKTPNPDAAWDTMAVAAVPDRGSKTSHTWMIHAPEYHGKRKLR